MLVDINEQVLIQSILEMVANKSLDKKAIINQFLIGNFMVFSHYREHYEKNFDDKIFFYEPINKYFDLFWHRQLALN